MTSLTTCCLILREIWDSVFTLLNKELLKHFSQRKSTYKKCFIFLGIDCNYQAIAQLMYPHHKPIIHLAS